MKAQTRISATQFKQAGIVLPLTLILLVILSILGIMAMRNATVGSQTMNGVRSYTMAEMAAEVGLRYCEEVVKEQASPSSPPKYTTEIGQIVTTPAVASANVTTGAVWRSASNWAQSGTNRITLKKVNTTDAGYKFKYPPQCMIQKMTNPTGDAFLITARGIGNDADYDYSTGKVKSGSEIWLQSILTPASGS
jgi:Tfp pilus assembly protein PilX